MTADADLATARDALDRATVTPSLGSAAQTVVQRHNPKAAPSLIKTLGYNNPAVAAVATKGLISLGITLPQLLESLDTNNYEQEPDCQNPGDLARPPWIGSAPEGDPC